MSLRQLTGKKHILNNTASRWKWAPGGPKLNIFALFALGPQGTISLPKSLVSVHTKHILLGPFRCSGLQNGCMFLKHSDIVKGPCGKSSPPVTRTQKESHRWETEGRTRGTECEHIVRSTFVSTRQQRGDKVDEEVQSSSELGSGILRRRLCPAPAPGNMALRGSNARELMQKRHLVSASGSRVSTRLAFFLQKDPGPWSAFVAFCNIEWREK